MMMMTKVRLIHKSDIWEFPNITFVDQPNLKILQKSRPVVVLKYHVKVI